MNKYMEQQEKPETEITMPISIQLYFNAANENFFIFIHMQF